MQSTNRKYVTEIALFLVSQVLFFYGLKYVMSSLDPNKDKKKEAEAKAKTLLDRYGIKDLKLTDYEQVIATELVHPDEIPTTFEDIGGLNHIIDDLNETVIYPLRYPELFSQSNSLLTPPKGVLLYGPPGCGKTMLAKALAKESGATFINMKVSTLTDKWYGESNKLVAGLFSLAYKIQPCIIFIDEIDSFLRERRSNDHEVTGMLKAEFMTLWDGLTSGANTRIMILGATNRPSDIDQAILRRMPKKFSIQPPQKEQRQAILKLILKGSKLAEDFDFDLLADITEGLSGSDLKEVCRDASMIPIKECIKLQRSESNQSYNGEPLEPRSLKTNDVLESAMRLGHIHSDDKLNNLVNVKLSELPEEPQD